MGPTIKGKTLLLELTPTEKGGKVSRVASPVSIPQGGRTYVMITYVSKENNNLRPDDKIRYI